MAISSLERSLLAFIETKLTRSFGIVPKKQTPTIFYSEEIPEISLWNYIERVYFWMDPQEDPSERIDKAEIFIMATRYIYKIQDHEGVFINSHTIHRLFFTAVIVASKFHEDRAVGMSYLAAVGGVPLSELLNMELKFCSLLNWNAFIFPSEYDDFIQFLFH